MPGVDPVTGTIYSDIFGSALVAIRPDGSEKWRFVIAPATDIVSTPTVGPDSVIYFGTKQVQSLYALNPDGTERWRFPTGDEVNNVPALSPDGTTVYFVSNNDNLYALKMVAREADPTGAGGINIPLGEWTFPILAESGEVNSSPTVNPNDGTIYVGSDDQNVYAINPDGTEKWRFNPGTGSDIESSAAFAIDPIDGNPTVYIGSDDDNVYALDAETGAEKWRFNTGANVISSPVVDLDGTIYVGSNDNNLYAINPDGKPKWSFATGGAVPSSPALGQAGFIHIGSNDTNFYTLSQFGDPRNFKDENKTEGKLLTFEDLGVNSDDLDDTNDWLNGRFGLKELWAVRLEVDRSLIANADGKFSYELSLWMRQCQTLDCSDINGTFFSDTRIDYENAPVGIPNLKLPMIQQFRLSAAEQAEFERFYFGFTGSTGAGQTQSAIISQFNLSFIRPGDPVVDVAAGDDPDWLP
jgi:outer membrane protein assembly factor BamB